MRMRNVHMHGILGQGTMTGSRDISSRWQPKGQLNHSKCQVSTPEDAEWVRGEDRGGDRM